MKKIILTPLFAPLAAMLFLTVFGVIAITRYMMGDVMFFKDWHICDITTYSFYALAFVTLLALFKDFKGKHLTWCIFIFLIIAAVLREMGVQHWLASKDTTAIKIRFFTNPNNPLHEKIIAASLVLIVALAVLYLIFKYAPGIWKGFWNKEPLYWTICSMCALGVICKIADRLPSNIAKSTGVRLSNDIAFIYTLIEESTEASLPLLAAIALLQYHFLRKSNQPSLQGKKS